MSTNPSTSISQPNFASIFNEALDTYKRKTKKDLASHPLLPRLRSCNSPEAIFTVLQDEIPFNQFENGDNGLTNWVMPTVKVLFAFSTTVGQGVQPVNIKIFLREELLFLYLPSGISISGCHICGDRRSSLGRLPFMSPFCDRFLHCAFQAAKSNSLSRDKLIDVFNHIESFFRRLETYTCIKPSMAMTDMIIQIMVEVLNILALATKEVKCGRLSELMSHKYHSLLTFI